MHELRDESTKEACKHSTSAAPNHHRARHRTRQQIGRKRRKRQWTEQPQQHRRHRQLSSRRGRHRHPQPSWTHKPLRQRSRPPDDARSRGHRQLKSHKVNQKRIDQQQRRHCPGQCSFPINRSTHDRSADSGPGHRNRTQHGGLKSGDHREQQQGGKKPQRPKRRTVTPGERGDHSKHKRHVLPRNDQQVTQPRSSKVICNHRCLASIIADHHPQKDRLVAAAQRSRPAHQGSAHRVGESKDRRSRFVTINRTNREPADHMTPAGKPVLCARWCDTPAQQNPLTCQRIIKPRCGCTMRHSGKPFAIVAHCGNHTNRTHRTGIVEQRHPARK